MKALVCVLAMLGCAPDCRALAAEYEAAFQQARTCVPGEDVCTYPAGSFSLVDDGTGHSCLEGCANACGGGNANPKRIGRLRGLVNEIQTSSCYHPLGCLCPNFGDAGPPDSVCLAIADGGGTCTP